MPDSKKIRSINPASGELIREFNMMSDADLEERVKLAERAYTDFKNTSIQQRCQWMKRVSELLIQNAEKYGNVITMETGKPINQGISEPKKCAKWPKYYAEHAEELLRDTPVETTVGQCIKVRESLGILLQIAPFNYPFLQCLRFLSACVVAGNVALIRHSHSTTMSAMLIGELFKEAGFPEGVVQILLITKDQVSTLIGDRRIRGVTITGSVSAGRAIAKQAGEHLKKHVMELGGSDAYIICDDVDMNEVIQQCVKGRITNNGQSCTSAKRFIVHEKIYDEFCNKLVERFKQIKMGDPMDPKNELGPLSREDLRDVAHGSVKRAVQDGAKLLLGGKIPDGNGFYYPATILADVTRDNAAYREEIFAPVAAIMKASDDKEAIELANSSQFGLGGGVFCRDAARADMLARKIEAGLVFVNDIVTSSPEFPFGGVKDSGYGKESGPEGLYEWVNTVSLVTKGKN